MCASTTSDSLKRSVTSTKEYWRSTLLTASSGGLRFLNIGVVLPGIRYLSCLLSLHSG